MFSLVGKVVLVTGSSRGLGKAIVLKLAEAGADIVLNDLDADGMQLVAEQVSARGRKAIAVRAHAALEQEVNDMFEQIEARFGRLDILVNNAGMSRSEQITDISLESWNELLQNNMTSTFLCAKYAMKMMQRDRCGRIIQVSSMVAHQGALYGHVHYAASKSAQIGFTKTLARTAAEFGITVNAVAPGMIDTELLRLTLGDENIAQLSAAIPLGLGQPEDVANAVLFLASDEAKYITGATLDINGGQYMR